MLGPHSPANKATFSSEHLNKWGPSHQKSNWSHRHLIGGFPPAAGMCTFDSPRRLEGCKGTAENDRRLRAHDQCSFVNLKRHCQDLKVKNWTKHALFLSDREKSDKSTQNPGKTAALLFIKLTLCGAHKTFVLCSPRWGRPPTEAPVSAHSWNWYCGTLPEVQVWLYSNADRVNFKHLCNSKTAKKEKKREKLCLPRRSWQLWERGKFTFELVSGSHKQKWISIIRKSVASCIET